MFKTLVRNLWPQEVESSISVREETNACTSDEAGGVNVENIMLVAVKLTDGQELVGYVSVDKDGEKIIKINHNIIIFKCLQLIREFSPLKNNMGFAFVPWIESSNTHMYVLNEKDVVTTSSVSDYHKSIYQDEILVREFFMRDPELANVIYGNTSINDLYGDVI